MEQGVSPMMVSNAMVDSHRPAVDDGSGGGFVQCSTSDWRWLIRVWTDSRGEFLDNQIFLFGGIGSRQDTKGLQCLFVQVLHQGCQILSCSSPDVGPIKPRDIIITRIGSFYELEKKGTQSAAATGPLGYLEGFNPVKSLGSTSTSYILIPSPSMHFLPPKPLQLPTCLTSDSPPLAHLLHSKGSTIPLSTGFVVSEAIPSTQKDTRSSMKEEWPSILSFSLVDYYGSSNIPQKIVRGSIKNVRSIISDARDHEIETHLILESVAAELHPLSWMTASPAYLERQIALPFHCDMILRLKRLIHYADKEIDLSETR
ncbi:hypothetical protein AQUCO_06000068v1 [Aquilegia coerulea]|uniref:Mediator of RNA polymerase II transcription subunit 13 n=1 Tax=Aquilegia coerulea TaxID=218851 RepID=A0A2G5CDW7_AQUCA|nr:hypothetical protein AQUCO_06000068v1 [Aquilegia coerulea]